jgi:hypothetical protein
MWVSLSRRIAASVTRYFVRRRIDPRLGDLGNDVRRGELGGITHGISELR